MSLRPRYSLLTLVILTALIAGGVKLWYGPHHVVERPWVGSEWEYTYTHDWRRDRVIDGPVVARRYQHQELESIYVRYYRNGVDCNWMFGGIARNGIALVAPDFIMKGEVCPLSERELQGFHHVRDSELQRFKTFGIDCDIQVEGYSPSNYWGRIGQRRL